MPRHVFIWKNSKFIELDPNYKPEYKTPFIITDSMPLLEHPASGKFYDSKSAFRRETKRYGLEEIGNSKIIANKKPTISNTEEIQKNILQAKAMIDSRTAPMTEKDRQICKNINERIKNKA